jgi:hypothetical protein
MAAEDLPRQVHNQEDITEERSFDELARALANGSVSRRQALRLMGGALLGGVLACIPGVALAAPTVPGSTLPPQSQAPILGPGNICPAGLSRCLGLCYDLSTDPCNCGSCGNVCPGSGEGPCCVAGRCAPPIEPNVCSPGGCPAGIRPR